MADRRKLTICVLTVSLVSRKLKLEHAGMLTTVAEIKQSYLDRMLDKIPADK